MPEILEYNIGHSTVSRAVFVGWEKAVTDILRSSKRDTTHQNASIQAADRLLIEQTGFPAHTLMETAGLQIAQDIWRRFERQTPYCILVGTGNNGGDGLVIARWLHRWGATVSIVEAGEAKSECTKLNRILLPSAVQSVSLTSIPQTSTIFIDSLLGNNQQSAPSGSIADIVIATNQHIQDTNSKIISVDFPTGIKPDTGRPFDERLHLPSNICYAIGGRRFAHVNAHYLNSIVDVDIGLVTVEDHITGCQIVPVSPISLPKYNRTSAKWNKGHVAIAAKGGAAVLTAKLL